MAEAKAEAKVEEKKAAPVKSVAAQKAKAAALRRKCQAAHRPLVTVRSIYGRPTTTLLRTPDVLVAPIRADIVNFVHTNMNKNRRQPYGVKCGWGPKGIVAGHQVSARSWGTGRAVSRVPRVRGGGTHRAGQGAFANICRGGRMFAPTKVWRRWHRKINKNQKRYAVASAIAASGVPALVMARGHRIHRVAEIPLVVEDDFEKITKTRAAMNALQALKLGAELNRCKRRYKRAGKGKARNRRWRHRTGPLIVFKRNRGILQAARNLRGVDFCRVDKLNLLKLAPGGHVGRLIIWTEGAFQQLNKQYGTATRAAKARRNYWLPRPLMRNSDLNRVLNSVELQTALRPQRVPVRVQKKRNPLKRPELYAKLNPLFAQQYQELVKDLKPGAKVRTTRLLKPLKKKQRVKIELSKEQKEGMQKYWDIVMGETIFKTREQLLAEKAAVEEAIRAAEREKLGLDLADVADDEKAAAPDEDDDDDSDDEDSD